MSLKEGKWAGERSRREREREERERAEERGFAPGLMRWPVEGEVGVDGVGEGG